MSIKNTDNFTKEINKHIGQKVCKIRQAIGISRKTLGDKINVSGQQISKYESGVNTISIGRLLILSKILNYPFELFFNDFIDNKMSDINKNQGTNLSIINSFINISNKKIQKAILDLTKEISKM